MFWGYEVFALQEAWGYFIIRILLMNVYSVLLAIEFMTYYKHFDIKTGLLKCTSASWLALLVGPPLWAFGLWSVLRDISTTAIPIILLGLVLPVIALVTDRGSATIACHKIEQFLAYQSIVSCFLNAAQCTTSLVFSYFMGATIIEPGVFQQACAGVLFMQECILLFEVNFQQIIFMISLECAWSWCGQAIWAPIFLSLCALYVASSAAPSAKQRFLSFKSWMMAPASFLDRILMHGSSVVLAPMRAFGSYTSSRRAASAEIAAATAAAELERETISAAAEISAEGGRSKRKKKKSKAALVRDGARVAPQQARQTSSTAAQVPAPTQAPAAVRASKSVKRRPARAPGTGADGGLLLAPTGAALPASNSSQIPSTDSYASPRPSPPPTPRPAKQQAASVAGRPPKDKAPPRPAAEDCTWGVGRTLGTPPGRRGALADANDGDDDDDATKTLALFLSAGGVDGSVAVARLLAAEEVTSDMLGREVDQSRPSKLTLFSL